MDQRWLLAAAAGLVAVLAGMWWGRGVDTPPPPVGPVAPTAETVSATTRPDLVIHVSGWVARPGLVALDPGSRVGDVIAAAGGVKPGAQLTGLNLAEAVADGQQVVVPGPGQEGTTEPGAEPDEPGGPVHLNSATAAQLETLPGVGPVLAERIVAHRETHGPFGVVEDLLEVSGIGEAKLSSIRDLVAVP